MSETAISLNKYNCIFTLLTRRHAKKQGRDKFIAPNNAIITSEQFKETHTSCASCVSMRVYPTRLEGNVWSFSWDCRRVVFQSWNSSSPGKVRFTLCAVFIKHLWKTIVSPNFPLKSRNQKWESLVGGDICLYKLWWKSQENGTQSYLHVLKPPSLPKLQKGKEGPKRASIHIDQLAIYDAVQS